MNDLFGCEACAQAAEYPSIYMRDCQECDLRHFRMSPNWIRREMFRLASPEQRERFIKAAADNPQPE